jgi:hypothetical protein
VLGNSSYNGTNGNVSAIAFDSSNQQLYVGGNFTTVKDTTNTVVLSTNYVARWDVSNNVWNQLGNTLYNGTNGAVNSLVFDASTSQLYVGGSFAYVNDTIKLKSISNNIAIWSINSKYWTVLGNTNSNGIAGFIYALALDSINLQLYVGGNFSATKDNTKTETPYNINSNSIATYDCALDIMMNFNFNGSGSAYTNGNVLTSFVDPIRNTIYIGGTFTRVYDSYNINGKNAYYLAAWDIVNSKWIDIGGTNGPVYSLEMPTISTVSFAAYGVLFVGGNFNQLNIPNGSDGAPIPMNWYHYNNYAIWTLTNSYSISKSHTSTYFNYYSNINSAIATGTAVNTFTAQSWINSYLYNGAILGPVYALAFNYKTNSLYIGGSFTMASNPYINQCGINNIAEYSFTAIGNVLVNWVPYISHGGTNGPVLSLVINYSGNTLYVGGNFTSVTNSHTTMSVQYKYIYYLDDSPNASNLAQYYFFSRTWKTISNNNNNGTNMQVNTLTLPANNNYLYVGGNFTTSYDPTNTSGISTNYIAVWDISNNVWNQLGNTTFNGTNNYVTAITINAITNDLYVGGSFSNVYDTTNTNGLSVGRIASWNNSTNLWKKLGPNDLSGNNGLSGDVKSLRWNPFNGMLYIGGSFGNINTYYNLGTTNNIARWDFTQNLWNKLGNGTNGPVSAIVVDSSNMQVYVGGAFTKINSDTSANNIAKWDINNNVWNTLGNSTYNGTSGNVSALTLDASNNVLYIGGNFTTVTDTINTSGLLSNYIAKWNVYSNTWLQIDGDNNKLLGVVNTLSFNYKNFYLYIGGSFSNIYGPYTCFNIAKWDIANNLWQQFGSTKNNGTDGVVYAMALNSSNSQLYVGGSFNNVSDPSNIKLSTNNIAKWDFSNNKWIQIGNNIYNGTNNIVRTLSLDTINNNIYVGGLFTAVNDVSNINLSVAKSAILNISNNTWSMLGSANNTILNYANDVNYGFNTMSYNSLNGKLYMGGYFSNITYPSIIFNPRNITRWNINKNYFELLGNQNYNGTNNSVYTMTVDSSGKTLYVGGAFTNVKGTNNTDLSTNYIAKWDITNSNWNYLGTSQYNGTNNTVLSSVFDISNRQLYIGGQFNSVQDSSNTTAISSPFISRWDVSNNVWNMVGNSINGINSNVSSLTFNNSTSQLFMGGSFTNVSFYQHYANNIASWDLSNGIWNNFGNTTSNGTSDLVSSIALDSIKNKIYVGGNFTSVTDTYNSYGLQAYRLAAWDINNSVWQQLGNASYNGTAGNVMSLTLNANTNKLHISGKFDSVNYIPNYSTASNHIARWDISNNLWCKLGAQTLPINGTSNNVYALALDSTINTLYVGGNFGTVQDLSNNKGLISKYIARWDTANNKWIDTNSVLTNKVKSFAIDSINKQLYVGGSFNSSQDVNYISSLSQNIAAYSVNLNTMSNLSSSGVAFTNGVIYTTVIDYNNNCAYVGGQFTTVYDLSNINGLSANNIAKWDFANNVWSTFVTGAQNGVIGTINIIKLDSANQRIYIGGSFTIVINGVLIASNLARWDIITKNWFQIGSTVEASVTALELYPTNNILYVGGSFSRVYTGNNNQSNILSPYFSIYNIITNAWTQIDAGQIGKINMLLMDKVNNQLYAAGKFTLQNNVAIFNLNNNNWYPIGNSQNNGTNGNVYALAMDTSNGLLYVGGSFNSVNFGTANSISSNNIAVVDIKNKVWNKISNSGNVGTNGKINTMSLDSSNQQLYIGGNFTNVIDTTNTNLPANYSAKWDITNNVWNILGNSNYNGTNGAINTMALNAQNNQIYLGGSFNRTNIQTGYYNYIGKYDMINNTWSMLGNTSYNGTSGNVNSLLFNTNLYVGGKFSIVFDASNSSLQSNNVATWNVSKSSWCQLGNSSYNGTNGEVNSIIYNTNSNKLFIGGNFNSANYLRNYSSNANNIAILNIVNRQWKKFGNIITNVNGVNGLVSSILLKSPQEIYVGGGFNTAYDINNTNGLSTNNIAKYNFNSNSWLQLGNSTYNGTSNFVRTLLMDSANNLLYVGGDFTTVSDTSNNTIASNYAAKWNLSNNTWNVLGNTNFNGANNSVNSLALNANYTKLFISGTFSSGNYPTNYSTNANNIAKWDISNQIWYKFGNTFNSNNGTSGTVSAIALDSQNNNIYVGGKFTSVKDMSNVSGLTTNRLSKWNVTNNRWEQLGSNTFNGTSGNITSLELDSLNNSLYVGGLFTQAQDAYSQALSTNYAARWDISNNRWNQLGDSNLNGTSGNVYSIKLNTSNMKLAIGGAFSNANYNINYSYVANNIARWDISNNLWNKLGNLITSSNGTNNYVKSLLFDPLKSNLYVGGNFDMVTTSTNTLSANRIAKWNITNKQWEIFGNSLCNGINGNVSAMCFDVSNNNIYVGGRFNITQDVINHIPINTNTNSIAFYDVAINTINNFNVKSIGSVYTNGNVYATQIDYSNNLIYVGGVFTTVYDAVNISGLSANNIAIFDFYNNIWKLLGSNGRNGVSGNVSSIALDTSNAQLYIGGTFKTVSDSYNVNLAANNVAIWDIYNNGWRQLGNSQYNGTSNNVNALLINPSTLELYVGGSFNKVLDANNKDVSANYIAKWDISNNNWVRFGNAYYNGTNGLVTAMTIDASNNQLYIGGQFTQTQDITNYDSFEKINVSRSLALYDESNNKISNLNRYMYGSIYTNGGVLAIEFDFSKNLAYVGGYFNYVYDANNTGGLLVKNIAILNLTNNTWTQFGNSSNTGADSTVSAMAFDSQHNALYIGGTFTYTYDGSNNRTDAYFVCKWNFNNSSWSSLGSYGFGGAPGVNGFSVNALLINNDKLYIGGAFYSIRQQSYAVAGSGYATAGLAIWNINSNTWDSQPGRGDYYYSNWGSVNCLKFHNKSGKLFVGGSFRMEYLDWDLHRFFYSYNVFIWNTNTSKLESFSKPNINWQQDYPVIFLTKNYNGLDGGITAFELDSVNDTLYIGGQFKNAYDTNITNRTTDQTTAANNIIKWDIINGNWLKLGNSAYTGINGSVNSLLLNSNNMLYVGGSFNNVISPSNTTYQTNNIAIFDVSMNAWNTAGTVQTNGVNGTINVLVKNQNTSNIFIGGGFYSANVNLTTSALLVNNWAKWDLSNNLWSSVNNSIYNGVNGYIRTLAFDSSYSQLYVAGSFNSISDKSTNVISANNIAAWDVSNSAWKTFGNTTYNGTNNYVSSLSIDSLNKILYVGGRFNSVKDTYNTNGLSTYYVASWDLSNNIWNKLGVEEYNGVNNVVNTIAWNNSTNQLYIGGGFSGINYVIKYTNNIAKWDISNNVWKPLGNVTSNGTSDTVNTIFIDESNNQLYVGGQFANVRDTSNVNGLSTNNVARWDISNSKWNILGNVEGYGTTGAVYALNMNSNRSKLYVGGSFTKANYVFNYLPNANNIAQWDIVNKTWKKLGNIISTANGVNNSVNALVFDSSNQELYVGGAFTYAQDAIINKTPTPANFITKWDIPSATWRIFGDASFNGTGDQVTTIALDTSNRQVYVGGKFAYTRDPSNGLNWFGAYCAARWDISNGAWRQLGNASFNGVNINPNVLTWNPYSNKLYLGGEFTVTNYVNNYSTSANNVAKWNVSTGLWSKLGNSLSTTNGTAGAVNAMILDTSNQTVYIGGSFASARDTSNNRGITVNNITKWDISRNVWRQFGTNSRNGTSGPVNAMALDSSNNQLYVGGLFTTSRDASNASLSTNNITRWDLSRNIWNQFGNTKYNGTSDVVYSLALDASNRQLYIGGNFTRVNDVYNKDLSTNYVARWDLSNNLWRQLGNTKLNGTTGAVYGLLWSDNNKQLYVDGSFTAVNFKNNACSNYIARWDITNNLWKSLGNRRYFEYISHNGTDDIVYALAVDPSNRQLFVGGQFANVYDSSNVNGLAVKNIASCSI